MTDDSYIAERLDAILVQTTKTNGRVTQIEKDVYGSAEQHVDGVVTRIERLESIESALTTIAKVLKWVVPLAASSPVVTIIVKALVDAKVIG